jgi:hypothetical protein
VSKRINVNPDHYKVAGRERPGTAAAKDPKQMYSVERAQERREASRRPRRTKTER